ncbi:MAG: sigma-70 family RNA polymerase sigma factor, partial [Prevotella sp.]|nr:sigma-70 family RNA polymerase sigma factor [Prevotella sp.]
LMTKKDNIERLFRANYPRMCRLANCILKDSEEARDVVSDIFSGLLDGKKILPESNQEAFLLACVRNRCLDVVSHLSAKERMMRHIFISTSPIQLFPIDVEQRLEKIRECAEKELTPSEKQVFKLRFSDGMKYREIAEHLSISEVAVYKSLSRALTTIKKRVL